MPRPASAPGCPSSASADAARLCSLLRAAAGLSPVKFHLALPPNMEFVDMDLSRFHRATSIELHAESLRLTLPQASGGLPALERLSLSGCYVDLAALVLQCPCLRVPELWASGSDSYPNAELNFEQEIEKHLVTNFSVLELHFTTMGTDYLIKSVGHIVGALVLHLLGMHRIRSAT